MNIYIYRYRYTDMICKLICDMVIRNITIISFTPLHKWHRFIPIHYLITCTLFGIIRFRLVLCWDCQGLHHCAPLNMTVATHGDIKLCKTLANLAVKFQTAARNAAAPIAKAIILNSQLLSRGVLQLLIFHNFCKLSKAIDPKDSMPPGHHVHNITMQNFHCKYHLRTGPNRKWHTALLSCSCSKAGLLREFNACQASDVLCIRNVYYVT